MSLSETAADQDVRPAHSALWSPATTGLGAALVLMAVAMAVPFLTGWNVRVGFPPIYAHWMPRIGPGTLIALPLAVLGIAFAGRLSRALTWPRLLAVSWLAGLCWLVALAAVDGRRGLSTRLDTDDMVGAARATTDVLQTLHEFVSRIPLGPDEWPVHVAGHPPGALLFFVVLDRVGLSGSLTVGVVVTLLASTVPVAVMVTLRTLGAEGAARGAAPFLVLAPAAIWEAVSADAVLTCVASWALACLAVGAVRRSIAWSLLAGLLFGACVMMSYGLPLLGFLAVGVLVVARSYHPLAWAVAAAVAVVLTFWVSGFSLYEAYPVLRRRYYDGIGGLRPATYWLWGDLAALCFSAGPVLGAAVACWLVHWRDRAADLLDEADSRCLAILGGAAILAVVAADASLMSKAEVERIWLPFVPWLLILCALLPRRWLRPALAVQVVVALLVQHLLLTAW